MYCLQLLAPSCIDKLLRRALQTHYVEMERDGTNIATDVMLPTITVQKGQKLPAVFFQTRWDTHAKNPYVGSAYERKQIPRQMSCGSRAA